MSITYTRANEILDREFGNTSFSIDSTLYFGLSTTSINDDGTGATEPVGGAYARIGLLNNKTNWDNAASAALTNLTAVTFVESTLSWGVITHVFIADALTSGNVLYFDALAASRTVQSSTTVLFEIGAITVQMVNS